MPAAAERVVPVRRRAGSVSAGTAALAVVLLAAWAWAGTARPHRPGDAWGLGFGAAGAVLLLVASSHLARRRLAARVFGSASAALRVHVAASSLAALAVLLHTGPRLPAGWLGWSMLGLLAATLLSGIAGLALERAIPRRLAPLEDADAPYDEVDARADALRREAEAAVAGAGEALESRYRRELAPLFAASPRAWRHLSRPPDWRSRRLRALRHLSLFLPAEDRARAAVLERLVASRLDLDERAVRQRLLAAWPWGHVPPSVLLAVLILWHLYTVWAW